MPFSSVNIQFYIHVTFNNRDSRFRSFLMCKNVAVLTLAPDREEDNVQDNYYTKYVKYEMQFQRKRVIPTHTFI